MPPPPGMSAAPSRLQLVAAIAFLIVLTLAGGASRADVLGQAVVRAASWGVLALTVAARWQIGWRSARPLVAILLVCIALPALQIVPLPPALWMHLPGRDLLVAAASVANEQQPWRPISMSPGATYNALGSLVVPAAALILTIRLSSQQQNLILRLIVSLALASSLIAILQLSGARFDNPFVNDAYGTASGLFANRNHFALFLAIGICLSPSAILHGRGQSFGGLALTVAVLSLLGLVLLATGSRAGLLLGALGLSFGLLIAWQPLTSQLGKIPRPTLLLIASIVFILLATLIGASLYLGRAIAIERALTMDPSADARAWALPVITAMAAHYFPVGSGFGAFDPVFRISEPATQLQPLYMNHAHNDWLEVVLDGGLLAVFALAAAVGWWGWRSINAWRRGGDKAKLGSSIILLVMIASFVDYPARTPLVMSLVVIGAVWLQTVRQSGHTSRSPRPRGNVPVK